MLLVTLASSGGYPTAISAGNVMSEPPPAAALIAPARKPATARSATAPALRSIADGRRSWVRGRGRLGSDGSRLQTDGRLPGYSTGADLARSRQFSSITSQHAHGWRRPSHPAWPRRGIREDRALGRAGVLTTGLRAPPAAAPPDRRPPGAG